MKTAAEILREAKAKIATPDRWTKGEFGRDSHGRAVCPPYPDYLRAASCLCVNGALFATAGDTGELMHSRAGFIMSQCARRRGYETASKFNDAPETTHADVLSLFDEAIAWAESDA